MSEQRTIHMVRVEGLGAVQISGTQPNVIISTAEPFKGAGYRLAAADEYDDVRRRIETTEWEGKAS